MKRKTIPLQTMLLTKFTVRHFVFKLVFNSNLVTMPDIIYTNFVLSVYIFNDLSYNVHKCMVNQVKVCSDHECMQTIKGTMSAVCHTIPSACLI